MEGTVLGGISLPSPLGVLRILCTEKALCSLLFEEDSGPFNLDTPDFPLLREAGSQLRAYFEGRLRIFDLPLVPEGTAFQQRVWQQLSGIPYGETRTYRDIAQALGKPGAARAVGQANGKNPLPILIPCHRVVAAGGVLGGYSSGLWRKRVLLKLER